jgi:glycosyltransferase involved in cell wall biosynthesis
MESALVSVVIPAYKQAEFVGEAIQSVLDQRYSNLEAIVVNDASPDHTSEVVRKFWDPRLKYIIHETNQGLPAARNTGMRASRGEIIAFLDADDFFHADKLQTHVQFLQEHCDVGVSYNARFELNHSSTRIRELWRPPLTVGLLDLVRGFPFAPSDMVLRRDWAFKAGLFDLSKGSAEDTDFPCRLALAGCRFAGVGRALNYRRYHSGRGRKNLPGRLEDVARALEAVFADPRCPAEVLAIRERAIKHHLMVIVSLALIQEETTLAQRFARDLIRLDSSVLEGRPCELVDFLMMESIADESLNHERLLQRIFAQLPSELRWLSSQYDWAVARGYFLKGIRAIMWDRPKDGSAHLARAAELRAQVDASFIQLLTYHLLNYENEFGSEATQVVLQKLVSYLKKVGDLGARQLQGSYAINRAFQDYRAAEYAKVPAKVLMAVASNVAYVKNRGIIAILLRSLARIVLQPHLKASTQHVTP